MKIYLIFEKIQTRFFDYVYPSYKKNYLRGYLIEENAEKAVEELNKASKGIKDATYDMEEFEIIDGKEWLSFL